MRGRIMAAAAALLVGLPAQAGGFDAGTFRTWADMRIDDRQRPDRALQASRKTFVYRDLETNAVLRTWRGAPLAPIEYPYQLISYELEGDTLVTWVEQGRGAALQRIGPGRDMTVRRIGDALAYTAPLFLDFPVAGGRVQAFENYDFFVAPPTAGVRYPYQISWLRYGAIPGGGHGVMHLVAWRVGRYQELPATIREYLDTEARLWREPPRDLDDVRRLQEVAP